VGSETIIDKSKSIKSVLMSVIRNKDVEGVMSVNACYGGTAALFNSIAYLQSDQGVNKYAIVIAADIAMYPPGPARPTGGVGAVAILLKRTHIPSITLQTHRVIYNIHI
jgi:hydroxymethylglutaryl-CoA synthase